MSSSPPFCPIFDLRLPGALKLAGLFRAAHTRQPMGFIQGIRPADLPAHYAPFALLPARAEEERLPRILDRLQQQAPPLSGLSHAPLQPGGGYRITQLPNGMKYIQVEKQSMLLSFPLSAAPFIYARSGRLFLRAAEQSFPFKGQLSQVASEAWPELQPANRSVLVNPKYVAAAWPKQRQLRIGGVTVSVSPAHQAAFFSSSY